MSRRIAFVHYPHSINSARLETMPFALNSVLALANAMILLRSAAWRRLARPGSDEYVPPRLRLLAALSLLLWLGVMTFGRLVGYA